MKKRILLFPYLFVIALFVGCSNSSSGAEKFAKEFLKQFKEESFFKMCMMSSYPIDELMNEYVGINIIDYSIKSTNEYKIIHTVEVHNDDDDMFHSDKVLYGAIYPDYEIIVDNETDWVIQSKEENLSEYIIIFDVEYSDLAGDTKRNSVTLTVTQKEPESDDYIVSEMIGIINPYSVEE